MDPWARMLVNQISALVRLLIDDKTIKLNKKDREVLTIARDFLTRIIEK